MQTWQIEKRATQPNHKITCYIQRQDYAGRYTIFSKVNFSLEELGKLIAKL